MSDFKVEDQLLAKFKAAIENKVFGYELVNKGLVAMAKKTITIIQQRTARGLDINGKPFAKHVPTWETRKRTLLTGKTKTGRKSKAKKIAGGLFWKATKYPDFLRLSGELFDDMAYEVKPSNKFVGRDLKMTWKIYIKDRSAAKAHGLSKKRKFFGVQLAKEKNQIINEFKRVTRLKGTGSIS